MISGQLTETPVRRNVIMMLQMRRRGLHVIVVMCGDGRRDDVVCLCEMGGEGECVALSTCTVVVALQGVVALSILCPNLLI